MTNSTEAWEERIKEIGSANEVRMKEDLNKIIRYLRRDGNKVTRDEAIRWAIYMAADAL